MLGSNIPAIWGAVGALIFVLLVTCIVVLFVAKCLRLRKRKWIHKVQKDIFAM